MVDRDDEWYRVSYYKYVKIEFHSHWGSEHYCPLTQLKVAGMTMLEDWMAENSVADTEDGDDKQSPGMSARYSMVRAALGLTTCIHRGQHAMGLGACPAAHLRVHGDDACQRRQPLAVS